MRRILLPLFFLLLAMSYELDAQCNLVAHYRLDGNAADSSSNANHGTFFGGTIMPGADRFNNPNGAVYFDGINDYINTFTTYDYQERTVSFWFNPDRVIGSNNMLAHDANNLSFGAFSSLIVNGNLEGRAGGGGATTISNSIQIGNWYHVSLVRTVTKNYYYLNGQLIDSSNSNTLGSAFQAYDKLVLGTHRSRSQDFYKGLLDDVKIFDCALVPQQVDSLYRDSSEYNANNFFNYCMIGSWPMDGNANDTTVYANHATAFGGGPIDTLNRFGQSNSAYYFDGTNDYLNTLTTYDYPELSISFWFKAERIGNDVLISMDDNALQHGALSSGFANNALQGRAGGNGGTNIINPVQTNVWYHVVMVRTPIMNYYYYNGQLVDSTASNNGGSFSGAYDKLIFGVHRQRNTRFFKGFLDDIFILSCAMDSNMVDSIYHLQLPTPIAGLPGDTTICPGDSVILNAPSGANVSFHWEDNTTVNPRVVKQAGSYWLFATNGIDTIQDTIVISHYPTPLSQSIDTNVCTGDSITVDYTNNSASEVRWMDNDTSRIRTFVAPAIYTCTLSWPCGSLTDSVILRSPDPLSPRFVDTAICAGTIQIGSRTNPDLNFLWSTGATASQISVSSSGTYWVSVRSTCDTVVDTFAVSFPDPLPNPTIPDSLYICESGDSLQIGVPISDPTVNFSWSNNANTTRQWVSQTGIYTLDLDNGCEQRSLKYEVVNLVDFKPEPLQDTTLCLGNSIFKDFNQWPISQVKINGSPLANGQYQFNQVGTFNIEYLQPCGSWRDTLTIDIVDCSCELVMPNAFTPNGDNLNDEFRIKSACLNFEYRLVIFNRWGIKVFENENEDDFWDGTLNGQAVPGGSFVYRIWYSSTINGRRVDGYEDGILKMYR